MCVKDIFTNILFYTMHGSKKYERQLTSFVIASSWSRNRKWVRKLKTFELKSINFGILSYNFRYIIENIEKIQKTRSFTTHNILWRWYQSVLLIFDYNILFILCIVGKNNSFVSNIWLSTRKINIEGLLSLYTADIAYFTQWI